MPLLSSLRSSTSFLVYVTLPAVVAFGVTADDQTISDSRTTAIDTTTLMGSSGKLTLTSAGSITVASGKALTVSGNHSLLLQGAMTSNSALSGIGLAVETGSDLRLTSTIDLEGSISVPGPTNTDDASSNFGLGLFGSGSVVGDLTLSDSSAITVGGGNANGLYVGADLEGDLVSNGAITVSGNGSNAINIAGDVTGDVTIDGSITARVADGTGVRQSGVIDGAFVFKGGMNIGQSVSTDSDGETVAAAPAKAGIYLSNDITGGVLLGGKGKDDVVDSGETVATAVISSAGGAPALMVENLKSNGSDLVLGKVSGLDYAIVHKGSFSVSGSSSGIDAWGMKILGGSGNAWTRVTGGLHLDNGVVDVVALDAAATGILIGKQSEVPSFLNRGTIESTTSVTLDTDDVYSAGGDATGVVIEDGAVMAKLVNEGIIYVSASGAGKDSYGVIDRSGTLTSINNSGTWYAQRGTNNDGEIVILDASTNTSGVDFVNTGKISGDVWLGAGNDTMTLSGGSFDGDIRFGSGSDIFVISGDAEFTGGVSHDGSLAFSLSGADLTLGSGDNFNVTTASLSGASTLYVTIDPVAGTSGLFTADGQVSIGEDVKITPLFDTFVTSEQSFEILTSGSLLLGGDQLVPGLGTDAFLMDSSLSLNAAGDGVILTVRPKTSAELSLTGNKATLFDNMFVALDQEDDLGSALAKLSSAEEVSAAMEVLLPDTSSASFHLAYSGARQLEASLNDRLIETTARRRLEGGFWARELVGFGNSDIGGSSAGADYLGAGVLVGFDKTLSENILWGVSTGFLLQGNTRPGDTGDDVSIFSPFVGTYLVASNGAAFLSGSTSIWYNSATRSRGLAIETVNKTIESTASGWTGTADLHAGYDLKLGGLHIRPKVGISYIHSKEGGYSEEGGGGGNFIVESKSFTRLEGVGRVAIGHDFRWSGQGEDATFIRPEVFAGYRKRLSGTEDFITSVRFETGTDFFDLAADAIAAESYEMGANLNIFSGFGAASLRYSYEKRDEWRAHFGGFNFQMTF